MEILTTFSDPVPASGVSPTQFFQKDDLAPHLYGRSVSQEEGGSV